MVLRWIKTRGLILRSKKILGLKKQQLNSTEKACLCGWLMIPLPTKSMLILIYLVPIGTLTIMMLAIFAPIGRKSMLIWAGNVPITGFEMLAILVAIGIF